MSVQTNRRSPGRRPSNGVGRLAAGVAGYVTLAIAVAAFAFVALGPRTGAYRTLTVLSRSMVPTIPAGSLVVVGRKPVTDITVGDVITYAIPVDDRRVVTHRVVDVLAPGVVKTRGDASNTDDPWVARLEGNTAWTVRASIPLAGYAISAMRQPVPRAMSLGLASIAFVLLGLRRIWSSADTHPVHRPPAGARPYMTWPSPGRAEPELILQLLRGHLAASREARNRQARRRTKIPARA